MTRLNKALPYGTIAGTYDVYPNARYTQGGKFFGANGELIDAGIHEGQRQNDGPEVQENEHELDGQHGRDGHDNASSQTDAQPDESKSDDDEGSNEEGHVLEPSESGALEMDKTDEELQALADSGMAALRKYAEQFGVKGVSKTEIISELRALR